MGCVIVNNVEEEKSGFDKCFIIIRGILGYL